MFIECAATKTLSGSIGAKCSRLARKRATNHKEEVISRNISSLRDFSDGLCSGSEDLLSLRGRCPRLLTSSLSGTNPTHSIKSLQIGFSGHATAGGTSPFVIEASNEIPGKVGLLFYGPGKRFQPFQGGTHCVQLPTKRVGVQLAGGANPCEGTYSFDFAAYAAEGTHPQVFPGALLACQWWSRDTLDPMGYGTALSNALYFGVALD